MSDEIDDGRMFDDWRAQQAVEEHDRETPEQRAADEAYRDEMIATGQVPF